MTTAEIKAIQRRVRMSYDLADRADCDDGKFGSKSIAAVQKHLRALMPKQHPWPKSDQSSLRAFYGVPGDESYLIRVKVPCSIKMKYMGTEIGRPGCEDDVLYVHRKVADSLIRVLVNVARIAPSILLQYAGVWNNRSVRGGSTPSLHAYGAAIDLDPNTNGNTTHWPTGATMPLEVMEEFAKEGWLPAGAFWLRDSMHFQATK